MYPGGKLHCFHQQSTLISELQNTFWSQRMSWIPKRWTWVELDHPDGSLSAQHLLWFWDALGLMLSLVTLCSFGAHLLTPHWVSARSQTVNVAFNVSVAGDKPKSSILARNGQEWAHTWGPGKVQHWPPPARRAPPARRGRAAPSP